MSKPDSLDEQSTSVRYRAFGLGGKDLAGGEVALLSHRTGDLHLLPRQRAGMLARCSRFATLESHIETCCRWLLPSIKRGDAAQIEERRRQLPAAVERALHALIDTGLLISEEEVRRDLVQLAAEPPTERGQQPLARIEHLCIPTRERPDMLGRSVASYAANARRAGRVFTLVVADDARSAKGLEASRKALASLGQKLPSSTYLLGRPQRQSYAHRLARLADLPTELLDFALLGDERLPTYGAGRNTLMLATIGGLALQVDDDTLCDLRSVPEQLSGLELTSGDPFEHWYFSDAAEAEAFAPPADGDFLGLHERLLGRTVRQCLGGDSSAEVDTVFEHMEGRLLADLSLSGTRVAGTFAGSVGDCGGGLIHTRLLATGDTRRRLLEDEGYATRLYTRYSLRAPRRPTLASFNCPMTMNVGLDQRIALPPFIPVLRNEDGVFGATLRACFPRLFAGYLPGRVIVHRPPEEHRTLGAKTMSWSVSTNLLLQELMLGADLWLRTDHAGSLRLMGQYLSELGSMSRREFVHLVRVLCLESTAARIRRLYDRLEEGGVTGPWREDLEREMSAQREAIPGKDFAVPSDLPGDRDERFEALRQLVYRWGQLLLAWPQIRATAEELVARGEGPLEEFNAVL